MKSILIAKSAFIILTYGVMSSVFAQAASSIPASGPPKLVNATPRPTGTPKPVPARVTKRRQPPKDLLQQKWPTSTESSIVPDAIQTAQDDLRIKFEKALAMLRDRKPNEALSVLLELSKAAPDKFEIQHHLGVSLAMLGKNDEAVSAFQRATKLNPRSAEAHLGLCRVLAETSRRIEAIDECREAVRLAPTRLAFKQELARLYLSNEQIAEAIEILGASQDDLVSMGLLGDGYFLSGEYYLAAGVYEKIALRWPSVSLTQLRLSQVYDYLERPTDSIAAAKRFVELEPKLWLAHIHLGLVLKAAGFFDEAILSLDRAVALDATQGDTYFALGEVYEILGDRGRAVENLRKAYRILPKNPSLAFRFANAVSGYGFYSEAIEPLEWVNSALPNRPDIMRPLGFAYLSTGKFDEGVALIERAAEISPLPPGFEINLSSIKNRHQLFAQFDELTAYIAKNPNDVRARRTLAEIYRLKGQHREREAQFLEIVRIEPTHEHYALLSIHYADRSEFDKALAPAIKAAELKPHHVYYLSLSYYSEKLGRLDDAIRFAAKSVELQPDGLGNRLWLGDLLLKKGNRQEALKEMQEGFSIAPNDVRPNFKLAWLYVRMGNREGAFRHYGILRGLAPSELEVLELSLRAHFGTLP